MSDMPRLSDDQLDEIEALCNGILPTTERNRVVDNITAALAELRSLRSLAREIGSNTPTLDDERLPYVELQVDRGSWEEVQKYAK